MVSDKFKKRFIKLKKENNDNDNDIRITKRYIDEKDTVYNLADFVGTYTIENINKDNPNSPLKVNKAINEINKYKSIVIEYEVTKSYANWTSSPYKLAFIVDYDAHGNIRTSDKQNKAYEKFIKDRSIYSDVCRYNEVKFNSVVTAVTVLRSRHYYEKNKIILSTLSIFD